MARHRSHRIGCWRPTPRLCAVLLGLAATGFCSHAATAGGTAGQAAAPRADDGVFWGSFRDVLVRLEPLLRGEAAQIGGYESQSGAVAHAQDLAGRYRDRGLEPSLTDAEVSAGLSDIIDVRNKILTNPDLCSDAYWGSFLVTLDDMERDLRAGRSR